MKGNKVPSVYLQKLHKTIKTEYIEELKAEGILVDYEVTRDPRRIIRLPGTIHHKGRPCKIISYEELDNFSGSRFTMVNISMTVVNRLSDKSMIGSSGAEDNAIIQK